MLGWMARRELSKPPSAFLAGPDFASLWEVACRWCDCDLTTVDTIDMPEQVKQ